MRCDLNHPLIEEITMFPDGGLRGSQGLDSLMNLTKKDYKHLTFWCQDTKQLNVANKSIVAQYMWA